VLRCLHAIDARRLQETRSRVVSFSFLSRFGGYRGVSRRTHAGSLIFVQELAEQVQAVVEAERDRLDAVLIFPSMPEVMRLNKVGGFTMASLGQSKSVVSEFMKKKKADDGSSFEEAMLKLLRTLPKVLKYLPGLLPVSHPS